MHKANSVTSADGLIMRRMVSREDPQLNMGSISLVAGVLSKSTVSSFAALKVSISEQ
jgi:hypothetical protein